MDRDPYTAAVLRLIGRIEETQQGALEQAAQAIFESLKRDGVFHVFGSGHSIAVAQEAFHRAGGLVPVNLIQEAVLSPLTPPAVSVTRAPMASRFVLVPSRTSAIQAMSWPTWLMNRCSFSAPRRSAIIRSRSPSSSTSTHTALTESLTAVFVS